MSRIIECRKLTKRFRISTKRAGLLGSLRSFVRRESRLNTAVSGFDLEVGPGEFVGLLGPNGAGKTTIIKMLTGINVPVRIGNVTVMPGDLVVGDREGVYFIPPQFATEIMDKADEVHVHDEWTRKKFDEGKYKSSEIYSSPRDPALKKEYDEYLKKRLEEIRGKK